MKLNYTVEIMHITQDFSTLDSGLRDETIDQLRRATLRFHFSTLDSGLRDETREAGPGHGEAEVISVPSTRVYAMKLLVAEDHGLWAPDFSTLDSGLRDETESPCRGRRKNN